MNSHFVLATPTNQFSSFRIRPRRIRWVSRATLSILIITALLLNYFSFFVPQTIAAAPDPTIEQQINIIDQTLTFVSTTYTPTDNSLGLVLWDSAKYTGDTVYFEAVLKRAGTSTSAEVALFSSTGTQVTGSEVTTTNTTYTRVRSSALTQGSLPSLESGVAYTVRVKCTGTCSSGNDVSVKATRLIIVQTNPTNITDTQTQIEIGDTQTVTSRSYSALTNPKFYYFDSSKFSGTVNAYFEASLQGGNSPAVAGGATLGNFVGAETGGKEEAALIKETVNIQTTTVRTGNYAIELPGSPGSYYVNAFEDGGDQGNYYILGFGFRKTANPSSNNVYYFSVRDDSDATTGFKLELKSSGVLELQDSSNTVLATGTKVLANNTWYFIEIAWQHLDSANLDLYIDGVSDISVTGVDLFVRAFTRYEFQKNAGSFYYDDIYCYSGASGTSDFLGDAQVFAYQGAGTGFTELGDALEVGSWANVGETPLNETNTAIYTSTTKTGGVRTNGTIRAGPSGDTNIDGNANIKGGKWLHRLQRGTGGGSTHYKRYGNSVDGMTDTVVSLTTSFANYFTVSESSTVVPQSNEYFEHGFRVSGAQDITSAEIWAFILHLPAESMFAKAKLQQCDEASCTWTDVASSEVLTTATDANSWVRKRSGVLTLTTGRIYRVAVANSTSTQQKIANSKLIIEQTAAGGLTDIETVHQYNNTLATDADSTYTSQDYDNSFDKANFAAGTFAAFFESTLKTSSGANAYFARLDTPLGEQTGTDTAYTRKRSADLWASLPASATDIDVQLRNASTSTTSSSTSWLVIQISALQIPENILLFLPLALFLPTVIRWWRGKKLGYGLQSKSVQSV